MSEPIDFDLNGQVINLRSVLSILHDITSDKSIESVSWTDDNGVLIKKAEFIPLIADSLGFPGGFDLFCHVVLSCNGFEKVGNNLDPTIVFRHPFFLPGLPTLARSISVVCRTIAHVSVEDGKNKSSQRPAEERKNESQKRSAVDKQHHSNTQTGTVVESNIDEAEVVLLVPAVCENPIPAGRESLPLCVLNEADSVVPNNEDLFPENDDISVVAARVGTGVANNEFNIAGCVDRTQVDSGFVTKKYSFQTEAFAESNTDVDEVVLEVPVVCENPAVREIPAGGGSLPLCVLNEADSVVPNNEHFFPENDDISLVASRGIGVLNNELNIAGSDDKTVVDSGVVTIGYKKRKTQKTGLRALFLNFEDEDQNNGQLKKL